MSKYIGMALSKREIMAYVIGNVTKSKITKKDKKSEVKAYRTIIRIADTMGITEAEVVRMIFDLHEYRKTFEKAMKGENITA